MYRPSTCCATTSSTSSSAGARAAQGAAVRVVDVDEASLQRLGQWPWSRSQLATLLTHLQAAGARVVAFDLVFSEPDRTAPGRVSAGWALGDAERARLLALPDPDTQFAHSLQQGPTVLGYALLNGSGAAQPPPPGYAASLVEQGPSQQHWLPAAAAVLPVWPPLQAAAGGLGALGFVPDADGVVRRVPLLLGVGERVLPSLLTETLRPAQGTQSLVLHSAGHAGLQSVRIGAYTVPTTRSGEMWLYYRAAQALPVLPAWQVLEQPPAVGSLAGSLVLVGSSAQGLMDLRFGTQGLLPGVQVHAQALEQVLGGHYLQRPAWASALEALCLLAGGVCLVGLVRAQPAARAAGCALALLALLCSLAWWAFVARGWLLDAATPALAWTLCYLLCSLWQHRARERQTRWLTQAFARYVSPNRVAWLLAHPEDMALGGRRQCCSFVFTDLAGFATLLEAMDPAQAVGLLNGYLDGMVAIGFAHEGTLDRIVGDALAFMFSAPVQQPDHRERALACALAMDAFAATYARRLQAQGHAWGQTRIGVHCGEVIVGNFGGKTVFDYRALGDPINTAARLESVNKQLGTRLCVSADVAQGLAQPALRPVGELLLAGKRQVLMVYEPQAAQVAPCAPLADYLQAYDALQAHQPGALARFAQLASAWPEDPLVRLHHHRLLAGAQGVRMQMAQK